MHVIGMNFELNESFNADYDVLEKNSLIVGYILAKNSKSNIVAIE